MLKQLTQFKSVIQGIENFFHFDVNCPVPIAKEALFECLKWVGQIEDAAKAAQEAQAQEKLPEQPAEEAKVEQLEEAPHGE